MSSIHIPFHRFRSSLFAKRPSLQGIRCSSHQTSFTAARAGKTGALKDRKEELPEEEATSDRSDAVSESPRNEDSSSARQATLHQKACYGRNILLTGGTSGIGLATAKRAILEGATSIHILTRDAGRGEEAVTTIRKETGCSDLVVAYLAHDLSKSTIEADRGIFKSSNCNTLINCAGISQEEYIVNSDLEASKIIWDINYHMPFKLSKMLLGSYARESGKRSRAAKVNRDSSPEPSWCIINVSSLLAMKGGNGAATYSATKAALNALSRATALEGGFLSQKSLGRMPPLRVNAVLPGYIDTPMTQVFGDLYHAKLRDKIPLRRFGRPEEVADAIMFLLRNEYANNCMLNLDGGLSAV